MCRLGRPLEKNAIAKWPLVFLDFIGPLGEFASYLRSIEMKSFAQLSVLLFCTVALAQCSGLPSKPSQGSLGNRLPESLLTEFEAKERASRVSDVAYTLFFDLNADKETYSGRATTQFHYRPSTDAFQLTIDFETGTVKTLLVNGTKVETPTYNGFFVTLPTSYLKPGTNSVEIEFEKPFSKSGDGFYRFKDPEDGRVYTFTDFEPFNANKLFPCFDQPDLKATYTMEVLAPNDWTVITAVRENKTKSEQGRVRWFFPTTLPFSTYIFSLHAGPYHVWKSTAKTQAGTIPLRLFARKTLAKYIDAQNWFKISTQGFQFFNAYFDTFYPFKKYDQVIVPDFNAGAMENVGAVTFSERFVFRGEPTRAQLLDRADVILHEMAHMWFGDLVTMKWWNDLWLNESFATFMAALASAEATEFKEAWQVFYEDTKTWAYWEDGLVTTHPIEVPVLSTDQAFANFDGITYGKGASVLKQVHFLIGAERFKAGVRDYFKKFAYKNAERKDFVSSLEQASGSNVLANWTGEWLQTKSFNVLEAEFKCDGGKITDFLVHQKLEDPEHSTLRAHKTRVGLYKTGGENFKTIK